MTGVTIKTRIGDALRSRALETAGASALHPSSFETTRAVAEVNGAGSATRARRVDTGRLVRGLAAVSVALAPALLATELRATTEDAASGEHHWNAPGHPVTHFQLENGMDVVVIEDRRAPVVQNMVWYRAGAADEPPGTSGVAHFLEHLLFKATDNLESGEFSKVVAANGGRDNAFTSHDYTAYHQRVAADRLELMMTMEADRMRNLRLTEDDIVTERAVIVEERNQTTDSNPGALFREQMFASLFLNQRHGIPIIGWRHEMETLGYDDVMAFYEAKYAPNNAIAVIAGDVDPEEVREIAERVYGTLPANPDLEERLRPIEPEHIAARRLAVADERVAQPYVWRAYLAPQRQSGDQRTAAALELLADLLGGTVTSVLRDSLEFGTGEALHVSASYSGTTVDSGSFNLVVVPAEGVSLEDAEAALDRELETFLSEGVDEDALARIKHLHRASFTYAMDNVGGVARRYGRALAVGLSVDDVAAWPAVVQSITADEIMAAARGVFREESSVTGWLQAASLEEDSGASADRRVAQEKGDSATDSGDDG